MNTEGILAYYRQDEKTKQITHQLENNTAGHIHLRGLAGSSRSLVAASVFERTSFTHIFILPDKETAAYFLNDLENLFGEQTLENNKKSVLFFPTTFKRNTDVQHPDRTHLLLRSEVISRITASTKPFIIVTYSEAIAQKVISGEYFSKHTLPLHVGETTTLDSLAELLIEYEFDRVDFVVEPGQFSIRGGIVDVFSFSNDYPYRIEFEGNIIQSLRSFDAATQLSNQKLTKINIVPNLHSKNIATDYQGFLDFIPKSSVLWIDDVLLTAEKINQLHEKTPTTEYFITKDEFLKGLTSIRTIEMGKQFHLPETSQIIYHTSPQPSFNKNFELLIEQLLLNSNDQLANFIITDSAKQTERIAHIFEDIQKRKSYTQALHYKTLNLSLHEGFVDKDLKIVCYTDHQIFERYHRFQLKDSYTAKEAITLKELYDLKPGDYVTHIDHGIGRFGGLEKIEVNGKQQEAIRLTYKDNDLLYVSIHSLHRISKYVGREGTAPTLHRLGSNAWTNLKNKTKQKVKDIAKDLIKLYAKRKASNGFAFTPDTYLQHELEASFIYEDTPDQIKSTADVKKDMQAPFPMDRLICGDVGFGKTEIAVRAAFKAVADGKQVALLVPTTILAMQHYLTFKERLKEFPCTVDYINRFKSTRQQKKTLQELSEGKVDILIGTHRLLSKDIQFKDIGLLIVDEEQKFGVSAKEKLKQIKVNVDTLTLTATPIPRTLQFSLMGARDLSIINTPPPNRYPIQTELCSFNESVIREAILYEISRGGQVFFVHNRIKNIQEVADVLHRLVPNIKIAIGHGQMDSHKLEQVMLDFIEGSFDVLLATTIIESGLDISNVNTIFINDAHMYGLSDLHQLRGRVGRTNKKAFCYLISPPLSVLTDEARKRLTAITEFSEIGSGFNIAMRDLDIRGAGNILGSEQSGFIADIGFEMYHKILDEAVLELKETEFKELYAEPEATEQYIKDCVIETDLEILLPDEYISSITERLNLYKELDDIETEEGLVRFHEQLTDRFGVPPPQTEELINTIRLRWMAKNLGFEKIVLKKNKLIGYFISKQDSSYFASNSFQKMLKFVQKNPSSCQMKESNSKLTLTLSNVKSISEAMSILSKINLNHQAPNNN